MRYAQATPTLQFKIQNSKFKISDLGIKPEVWSIESGVFPIEVGRSTALRGEYQLFAGSIALGTDRTDGFDG